MRGYIQGVKSSGSQGLIRLESKVVPSNVVTESQCYRLVFEQWDYIIGFVGDAVVDS
jgi:hypothetical protein